MDVVEDELFFPFPLDEYVAVAGVGRLDAQAEGVTDVVGQRGDNEGQSPVSDTPVKASAAGTSRRLRPGDELVLHDGDIHRQVQRSVADSAQ
jgi:hypothetical protein